MKKIILFLFAVLTLRGSPQSGDIDTLYYLHDTTHFITEYGIAEEIYNIHTKFFPQQSWQAYRILELHLLFRPSNIGDTIQSISFYKDTLQALIYSHLLNIVLDSNNVFPNWLKIIIDDQTPITGEIEVPAWWGDLCEVDPPQISGNTLGFYETSQSWGIFHDLPIKLIIQQIPVGVQESIYDDFRFTLEQNYPNPFNPSTRISWQSPVGSWQTLKVYDILGNEAATLVDEYKPAGSYEDEFNAVNLPSGVYFYQMRVGDYIQTKKMILLR